MMFFPWQVSNLNDGELKGFEKEPYVQEIIGGKEMNERVLNLLSMCIDSERKRPSVKLRL